MKHQPFEYWLFERKALSRDQARDLEDHLATCDSCRALANAWTSIEDQIHSASMIAPVPGFTQRWRSRLADHRRWTNQRQMSAVLLTTTLGLVGLAILFGVELLPLLQPAIPTLMAWGSKVANLVANLNLFRMIISILIDATIDSIPLVYQVSLPLCLAGLAALWVVSLHRFSYRRIRKE
jgi:predicted anti-sigma-YlaC factor YlaD